jgi:multimeric flavodoxin WrbA
MSHKVLAVAGSPRRNGNSEKLLDSALAGVVEADPSASVHKVILNELRFTPCQNCGFCSRTGFCRFAEADDMKGIYEMLDASDRFIIASPIYFASVSAQLKMMIDRCQAIWARKYLLNRRHPNPDRKALFLCCGGFKHDRFYKCARQVITAWCAVMDIKLTGELFYQAIDARGQIEKHPTALADAAAAGRALVTATTDQR